MNDISDFKRRSLMAILVLKEALELNSKKSPTNELNFSENLNK